MLNRGQYPYKWLWTYAGDTFLRNKIFTGASPRPITTFISNPKECHAQS